MSALFRILLPIGSLFVFISACSNGGQNSPAGAQCEESYKPINMSPAPNLQKVSLKPNDTTLPVNTINLPVGTYSYSRADLYYSDNRKVNDGNFNVHIQDVPQGDGKTFKPSMVCARDVKSLVIGTSVDTMGVSQIKVSLDPANPTQNIVVATAHKYAFTLEPPNGLIKYDFPLPNPADPATKTFPSLEQAFDKSVNPEVLETIMVKHSDAYYEIRSRYASQDSTGSWYLSVLLTYTK
jgi:hypothetical protein